MRYVKGYKGEMLPGPVRGGMPVKGPRTIGVGIPNPVIDIGTGGSGGILVKGPRTIGVGIPNPVIDIGTGGSGGMPRPMKKGGSVSSASKRADGCAVKGKTKGRMV